MDVFRVIPSLPSAPICYCPTRIHRHNVKLVTAQRQSAWPCCRGAARRNGLGFWREERRLRRGWRLDACDGLPASTAFQPHFAPKISASLHLVSTFNDEALPPVQHSDIAENPNFRVVQMI